MTAVDKSLLDRVARSINQPVSGAASAARGSILKQAARSYHARPIVDEMTVPSGFDPQAAVLFEATVEAAFLVAACDGVFDEDERMTFEAIVVEACDNIVEPPQIGSLLADFNQQLTEDGIDRRIQSVARSIIRRDHQLEVLRIAALIAHQSHGVSDAERAVLEKFARTFDLPSDTVDRVIAQADNALRSLT